MEYICGVAWLAIMVVLGSGYWLIVQDGKIRETDGSNVKKKMFNSDTKVGKDISRR